MNKEDAFRPFKILQAHAARVGASLGLSLERFVIIPGDGDEPDVIQVAYTVSPDAVMSDAERQQVAYDKQFDDMMAHADDDEEDKRLPSIRDDLQTWLDEEAT